MTVYLAFWTYRYRDRCELYLFDWFQWTQRKKDIYICSIVCYLKKSKVKFFYSKIHEIYQGLSSASWLTLKFKRFLLTIITYNNLLLSHSSISTWVSLNFLCYVLWSINSHPFQLHLKFCLFIENFIPRFILFLPFT